MQFVADNTLCTKRPYTKKDALTMRNLRKRSRRYSQVLRIYQCRTCNWWHLTHHTY